MKAHGMQHLFTAKEYKLSRHKNFASRVSSSQNLQKNCCRNTIGKYTKRICIKTSRLLGITIRKTHRWSRSWNSTFHHFLESGRDETFI